MNAKTTLELPPTTQNSKLTAGDVVLLKIAPPQAFEDAEPSFSTELKAGPVEWNSGRILWWKPFDPATGQITLALTSYVPKVFEIKPIAFVKDSKPVFESEVQTVEYVPLGKQGVQTEIYEPSRVAFPTWVWVTSGAILLLALAAIGYAIFRFLKNRRALAIAKANEIPPLNPIDEFRKTLEQVEKNNFIEREQFKKHYFGISEASKRFLGRTCRFDAEDKTTRELVSELKAQGFPEDERELWKRLFETMDIVKFTDLKPDSAAARALTIELKNSIEECWRKRGPRQNEV